MFEARAEGDRIALPVYAGAQMIQTSIENKYRFHMQVSASAISASRTVYGREKRLKTRPMTRNGRAAPTAAQNNAHFSRSPPTRVPCPAAERGYELGRLRSPPSCLNPRVDR
jgi:hypothetical protein